MDKPLFYIGFGYYLTLVLLALTGTGFAVALLILAVAGAGIFAFFNREHKNTVFIAVFLVCALACVQFMIRTEADYKPTIALDGKKAEISGKVIEVCRDSPSGAHRCIVRTKNPRRMKVRLSSKKYTPHKGDSVSFHGTLYKLDDYWRCKRLYLGAYTYGNVQVIKKGRGSLKETISSRINGHLGEPYASLLAGMLIGDKDDISSETQDVLRETGVLHLFAVSGFHCSLWTMLLWRLLTRLHVSKRPANIACILFLFGFCALTGFSRSCLRASVMLTVFFLGRIFLQRPDPKNSLGFAVFLISVGNPFSGGDPSILLSATATLGVLTLYRPIMSWCDLYFLHRISNHSVKTSVEKVVEPFVLSLCTFVFTLPAMSLIFGTVSLISPFTNLLISPAASLAILLTGLGVLNIPLLQPWLFLCAGLSARYILFICNALSKFQFASINLDTPWFLFALACLLVLIALSLFWGVRRTCSFLMCGILILSSVFSYQVLNRHVLIVDFPDKNCATLCYDGSAAVIERGGEYTAANRIQKSLSQNGGRDLIALIGSDRLESDLQPERTITVPSQISLFPDVSVTLTENDIVLDIQGCHLTLQGKSGLRIFFKDGRTKIARNDIANS